MPKTNRYQVILDRLLQEFGTMCGHWPIGQSKSEIEEAVVDVMEGREYRWVHDGEVVRLEWLDGGERPSRKGDLEDENS